MSCDRHGAGGQCDRGGDLEEDQIVPDAMRALAKNKPIIVLNPNSTRPWQHVLEPLGEYLRLAEALAAAQTCNKKPNPYCEAFNFGPTLNSNRPVKELVATILQH